MLFQHLLRDFTYWLHANWEPVKGVPPQPASICFTPQSVLCVSKYCLWLSRLHLHTLTFTFTFMLTIFSIQMSHTVENICGNYRRFTVSTWKLWCWTCKVECRIWYFEKMYSKILLATEEVPESTKWLWCWSQSGRVQIMIWHDPAQIKSWSESKFGRIICSKWEDVARNFTVSPQS